MKFGISLPNNHGVASIRDLVGLAVRVEQLGFASVWVSEHLFHSSYVAERLGDKPYHEALTVLTAVACATEKVRLGTSVSERGARTTPGVRTSGTDRLPLA